MRLLMAVSCDGYVARGREDRMDWLGPHDKAVFRVLTSVGGLIGVGARTAECMPLVLRGRTVTVIRNLPPRELGDGELTLPRFEVAHPSGWLIGGQTVALEALRQQLVTEVHLCRSDRAAVVGSVDATQCVPDGITPLLQDTGWYAALRTRFGDVVHECWRTAR